MAVDALLGHAGEVEPEAVPDIESVAKEQRFQELFGVSEDDLVRQGIDPGQYVLKNLSKVLEGDESKAELFGVPKSSVLLSKSMKWGWRFYEALFAGFVPLLIIAAKPTVPVKVICGSLAVIALVIAVWMMSRQFGLYRKYKEACEGEGIEPETMLGRTMPRWRKKLAGK